MNYTVSDKILSGSSRIWDEFYTHPFVLGIADGTLSEEKFKYFMKQDYMYLFEYAKVFSIGASKAYDTEMQKVFSGYVSAILNNEMEIHRGYMKRLGIEMDEVEKEYIAQDNLSYTSFMLRVAYEMGPAEICAAILPCAVSYEMIARRMIENNPECVNHPFYGEWIRGYAAKEYHDDNEELKMITEEAARGLGEEHIEKLVEIGRRSSIYERNFWDMSWEMRK